MVFNFLPAWCGRSGAAMALAAVVATAGLTPALAQSVDSVTDIQSETVERGAEHQDQVDRIDDQTGELRTQYRAVLEQLETVQIYNRQLERLIAGQEEEKARLQRQIDRVETIERDVTPLMEQMANFLGTLVANDVPFLPEERAERVERINELMSNPNVTNAERYRRILEAYQIENEYGRTFDTYDGTLDDGRSVQFLRLGRLALIYRNRDGSEMGYWDHASNSFQPLSDDYALQVRQASRIANQQVAPELMVLPVPTAETAE